MLVLWMELEILTLDTTSARFVQEREATARVAYVSCHVCNLDDMF